MSTLKLASRISARLLRNDASFLKPMHISPIQINSQHLFSSVSDVPTGSSRFLKIQSPSLDGNVLNLSRIWLRDHCRCPECYNSVTCQRNLDILKLTDNVEVKCHNLDGETLDIQWSDGHKSSFALSWLLENTYEGKMLTKQDSQHMLWDRSLVENLQLSPIVQDQLKDESVLAEVFRRVVKYGFAKIEQVPPTVEGTQRVCEQITRLSNTFFGSLWENGTSFDHKDTGYLNGYLEAHNDTTYFTEAQGILVFHTTQFTGTGGESLLVDGFNAAKQLKQLNPEAYQYLSNTPYHSEYIEPGEHFKAVGPVLRHDPVNRQLEQIRFNMLDRAPLSSIPQTDVERYYEHMKCLASIVRSEENEYWFRLTPGTVLVFDNWRLLHGRAGFNGKRVLNGCYFSRSEFMSRARHLKVV